MDLTPTAAVERVLAVGPSAKQPTSGVLDWQLAPGEVSATGWSEALEAAGVLRRWLEAQEAVLVSGAHRAGWSAAEVARLLGVDRRRVWEKFRNLERQGGGCA